MATSSFTREAAEAHRRAIAARFGERILAGDAVFLDGHDAAGAVPITVSAGVPKPIGGFNSWMLRQVMRDRGWTDPRFFTAQQLLDMGVALREGAPAVMLQYVAAVGSDGAVLDAPEVRRVPVFGAVDVVGLRDHPPSARLPVRALEAALVDADFEIGASVADALADWVTVVRSEVGQVGVDADPLTASLADAMALATASAQIEIGGGVGTNRHARAVRELLADDPERLGREPGLFFHAVRAAELTSGRLVALVRAAQQQLNESERLQPAQSQGKANESGKAMNNPGNPVERKRVASPRVQALFDERQAVLAVPFKEKDRAQGLGAVFYPPLSVWFVPPGADLRSFKEWDPREHSLGEVASEREIIEQFAKDMDALGLEVPSSIEADGQWHNVPVTTKKGKNKSGAYVLDLMGGDDGSPKGAINNKHSGEWMTWTFDGPLMTLEQKARMREAVQQRSAEAERHAREAREVAATHAAEIVAQGQPADAHPYVTRKGISAEGLLQVPGDMLLQYPEFIGESGNSAIRPDEMYLIVPMHDFGGRLRAVQAINWDGSVKSFMRGAQKQGTSLVLGAPSLKALCEASAPVAAVAFAEGIATGASWRRPTGLPTVVCFDAGNLESVAAAVAKHLPASVVPVLAVDNDQFHVEQALGQLAHRLGVNPNSRSGSVVEIMSSSDKTRLVSLGDAVADGEWHQAPRGRYRMTLEREPDSTEVRSIRLELLGHGHERASSMKFSNRGVEAGRVAAQAFAERGPGAQRAVLVVPEFRDLSSRPSDWNDLAKLQGYGQVGQQVQRAIGPLLPKPEQQKRVAVQRSVAGVSR